MELIAVDVFVENPPITPTLMWKGTPLFDVDDGVKVVNYCKNNDIVILGIEGFQIKGDNIIPGMDYIVDFSALPNEMNFAEKSITKSR